VLRNAERFKYQSVSSKPITNHKIDNSMKKKKLLKTSADYSVYQLLSNPDLYYAIHKTEEAKINKARIEFPDKNYPDNLIVKGYKLGKVGVKNETTDFWDIINLEVYDLKINDICSVWIDQIPPSYS